MADKPTIEIRRILQGRRKMNNKKQIALVTGALSGIGEAISRELAKRGWLVIGIARSSDKLSQNCFNNTDWEEQVSK